MLESQHGDFHVGNEMDTPAPAPVPAKDPKQSEGTVGHVASASERPLELEGDEAVQVSVTGLVDHAHAAFAELLDDLMVRQAVADHTIVHTIRFS